MNYFEQKSNEIAVAVDYKIDPESIKILDIKLKEIARDMRHQLCGEILKNAHVEAASYIESNLVDRIQRIIMNFEPTYYLENI